MCRLLLGIMCALAFITLADASSVPPDSQEEIISDVDNPLPFYKTIESQWGGHFKVYGSASWHDDRTVFEVMGKNPYYDGHTDFRLKNKLYFSDRCNFVIHYENILSGGNTLKKQNELLKMFPGPEGILPTDIAINDNRRFFDLTSTIDEDDDYILYHRLDRFMITIQSEFGTISLGRQAQTWGNGFLFNPMDLINPFAPTDINRDYKAGDDMISAQFDAGSIGNLQFLGVPRRDPSTNELESSHSSVAGKLHFASGANEFDVILARHYEENVTGFGTVGYLGGAAWRLDIVWSSLEETHDRSGYVSIVANMDYSWIWKEKNWYGFMEFYYNDLGSDDYAKSYTDPEIIDRILRGEMFTLGRTYISGTIQTELHPLFNLHVTLINNLADPSGIIQPRGVWDISQNFQLTFGATLYYGSRETEFGTIEIPGTNLITKPPDNIYLWLTRYF